MILRSKCNMFQTLKMKLELWLWLYEHNKQQSFHESITKTVVLGTWLQTSRKLKIKIYRWYDHICLHCLILKISCSIPKTYYTYKLNLTKYTSLGINRFWDRFCRFLIDKTVIIYLKKCFLINWGTNWVKWCNCSKNNCCERNIVSLIWGQNIIWKKNYDHLTMTNYSLSPRVYEGGKRFKFCSCLYTLGRNTYIWETYQVLWGKC